MTGADDWLAFAGLGLAIVCIGLWFALDVDGDDPWN